jgi:hypothetical protein
MGGYATLSGQGGSTGKDTENASASQPGHCCLVCEELVRTGAQHKKPPPARTTPEGASAHAPLGNHPARRAEEQGGISIAALLMARATATQIVRPGSPGASHLRLVSLDGAPAPCGQEINPLWRERLNMTPHAWRRGVKAITPEVMDVVHGLSGCSAAL